MIDTTNPFVEASRIKLRFNTTRGHFSTEDLWDLTLKNLDIMGREIRDRLKEYSSDSLLENPDRAVSLAAKEDNLRFDLIKAIIDVKQAENKAAKAKAAQAAELEFLNKLKGKKKLDELESMSLEEIEARIAAVKGADEPVAAE